MAVRIVDLDTGPDYISESTPFSESLVVCRASDPGALADGWEWVDSASFTLVDFPSDDRRVVTVSDLDAAVSGVADRVDSSPLAARICDDVLRANAAHGLSHPGLVTESLAYSTLQGGPEFASWLAGQPPRRRHEASDSVELRRDRGQQRLSITFNRPEKHNAFSNSLRAGLLEGLDVALLDPEISSCVLRGAGRSFCSGGDLLEFGLFQDVAVSHIARTRHSPAVALDALARRLGSDFVVELHGAVMGSGLEMAAFCGTLRADSTARFGLPELTLGLIPGAGGTVSVPRRIGRWRTAYLVMSGEVIDVSVALGWGLIDDIVDGSEFCIVDD
ncbi:enoyl-CoA hydratase/isomerase family protein [Dietzia psychralcaliphila]|uniref:enoyl-CoA hydratase/isomerase family protein n=1 Tax=Dietzia psychralcaliphila TaxID=139021 RepID=UPI001C1E4CC1|nr:enoyl-CoA hydratase/isomerase family protein [Dietzia psychralcaliphila]